MKRKEKRQNPSSANAHNFGCWLSMFTRAVREELSANTCAFILFKTETKHIYFTIAFMVHTNNARTQYEVRLCLCRNEKHMLVAVVSHLKCSFDCVSSNAPCGLLMYLGRSIVLGFSPTSSPLLLSTFSPKSSRKSAVKIIICANKFIYSAHYVAPIEHSWDGVMCLCPII